MIEFIIIANSTRHSVFVYLEQYFQGTLAYRLKVPPTASEHSRTKEILAMVLQTNKKPAQQLLTMKHKISPLIYKYKKIQL